MSNQFNAFIERHDGFTRLLVIARCAILKVSMRGVEYMLAFIAVLTGMWMGWPVHNLYRSDTTLYNVLCDYMPSFAWTLIFTLPAIPSIFFTGHSARKTMARIAGMAILLSGWVLASLLFTVDKSPHLATAWTPVFAFYQAWAMLHAWLRLDSRATVVCESCPNP